jgi:hypothetical protein
MARSRAALQLEVLALRHQLQVLQRTRPRRLRLAKMDRWLWALLSRSWAGWRTALVIVKPETVICLAPAKLPTVVGVESRRRRAADRARRCPLADPRYGGGEPAVGRTGIHGEL